MNVAFAVNPYNVVCTLLGVCKDCSLDAVSLDRIFGQIARKLISLCNLYNVFLLFEIHMACWMF
jgi:glycerol-3-phosphate O-acyltransferase